MTEPTPPARPEAEDLEEATGLRKRVLTASIDGNTGELDIDATEISKWEMVGVVHELRRMIDAIEESEEEEAE